MDRIVCRHCGHEFAVIEGTPGQKSLTVHEPGLRLTILSKEEKKGALECPRCGKPTEIDLGVLERF